MQEADSVYVLNSRQYLAAELQSGTEGEASFNLTPPQLCQILALQGHNDVVEFVIAATANESADMVLAYRWQESIQIFC